MIIQHHQILIRFLHQTKTHFKVKQYSDMDLIKKNISVFRCFMMYDYNKKFFFMFTRRGFPIGKTWSKERNKFEKEIRKKYLDPDDPQAKPQEPPLSFKYKGNFWVYQAKYDKAAKCYFILLSRFGEKEDFQRFKQYK